MEFERIVNWYKLRRRLKRGVRHTSDFVFSNRSYYREDFAWHAAKQNPHRTSPTGQHTKTRVKALFIVLAASIVSSVAVGIYHPFFRIKQVDAAGLQRINNQELEEAIIGMINYKRLLVLPGNSYFLVDVEEIKNIIKDRFPVENILVKKSFPASLSVQVEEKISTIIYDNGKEYSYLDGDGNVVEIIRQIGDDEWIKKTQVTTSTNEIGEVIEESKILEANHTPDARRISTEIGDYPILYDKRGRAIALNTPAINKELAQGIISWFNLINKKTDVSFGYVIIEDERGEGEIATNGGGNLKVRLTDSIELQFVELQHLLAKEKINLKNINYIDLRFLGKVYWQ